MSCAAALLLAVAAPALAARSTVFDSVATFATYHNIGIKLYYHGDDDSDMTVAGGVTLHGAAPAGGLDTLTWFRSTRFGAHNLSPNQGEGTTDVLTYWATSINMCGSDSLFDVYIDVADADSCTGCPRDFTSKVRPTTSPRTLVNNTTARLVSVSALGRQVFMSPHGSDANTGRSRSSPVATFARAASLMTTQGDQLRLLAGTYYTQRTDSLFVGADTRNGTGSRYYSVVGDTGGVVISGADTLALSANRWICVDLGGGTLGYRFDFSSRPVFPRTIVLGDSIRLYPYKRLHDLITDPLDVVPSVGGYWFSGDGKLVYIRPPNKVVPHGATLGRSLAAAAGAGYDRVRVASKTCAMRIESAFWRVDSLTFRDFGVGNDVGISSPVVSMANQGGVVENCRFEDLGRPAVGVRNYWRETRRRSGWNTIQNNTFIQHTLGMTWNGPSDHFVGYDKMAGTFLSCTAPDTNCHEMMIVQPTVMLEIGRGHVVRWNNFNGGSDATVRSDNVHCDTTTDATTDIDIYQNVLMNLGDDNIEPDATCGLNWRVYKNMILGGHTALNWYVLRGPFWFMFNTCINQFDALLPRGNDRASTGQGIPRGHVIVANNTFASRCSPASDLWSSAQSSSMNSYVNVHCVNNIMGTAGVRTFWEGGCKGLNEFNWNIHHRTRDTFNAAVNYTGSGHDVGSLQAWRDSSGYGANDGWTASLQFADSLGWDWSPRSTWTEVLGKTHARSLPGVNTNTARHVSPAWKVNPSGSSDSTYVGAWNVSGYRLEAAGFQPRR